MKWSMDMENGRGAGQKSLHFTQPTLLGSDHASLLRYQIQLATNYVMNLNILLTFYSQ